MTTYEELAAYERIYSLHVSSKVSGTFQSAELAAQEIGGDKVRVVDSLTASLAIAMLAHAVQRRLARGTTDEEIGELVDRFHRDCDVVFTVETLEYLQRGGRIGRAQAIAGSLLNLRPVLGVEDGVVVAVARVRGLKKASPSSSGGSSRRRATAPGPAGRDRPRRRRRLGRDAVGARLAHPAESRDRVHLDARRRRRERTPGPARSASSGSKTRTEHGHGGAGVSPLSRSSSRRTRRRTDNERWIASGWLDGQLSPLGRRQAKELGERHGEDELTAVFVSDLGAGRGDGAASRSAPGACRSSTTGVFASATTGC